MADYLARDDEHVEQVARQIRMHLALRVLFMPFVRTMAAALAHQAQAGSTLALAVAAITPVHIPVVAHIYDKHLLPEPFSDTGNSDSRNAVGSSSSSGEINVRAMYEQNNQAKKLRISPSLLPYLIAGALVLVGVIGLVIVSNSGATPAKKPTETNRTPEPLVTKPIDLKPIPATATPPPIPIDGSVPPSAVPVVVPLQVALVGIRSDSHPYAGHEIVLRSELSPNDGVVRVEYWNAENKLGEATKPPWNYAWTPNAGAMALSARAINHAGQTTTSPVITLTAITAYGSGGLRREWWARLSPDNLRQIEKINDYPNRPHGHDLVKQFAAPQNWGDNYLQRLWGFVIPPLDGEYVFWLAADDDAVLLLSNDDTPATRQRIAISPPKNPGTKYLEWDRLESQRSAPIRLRAGKRYLIEALHKEFSGDDHIEVGWQLPNGTMERPIPGIHLSPPIVPETPAPGTPSPKPAATPMAVTIQPPPQPTWKLVRAINLGGDTVVIDGVSWQGHKEAEEEGETPAKSFILGPWLSDLKWTRAKNGANNSPIQLDRSNQNQPLTINKKVYAKGLGVHANSEIIYDLDGTWSGFKALVGLDDEVDATPGIKAEVIFQVWLDKKKVFDSGTMNKGNEKEVQVLLAGANQLRLVVDSSGPDAWDHANWVNPQFLRQGGNDGMLQVKVGKRSTATFNPKPDVDDKMRSLLTKVLLGTVKEGLEFSVKVPNGSNRVWLLFGESGPANSHQFELAINGVAVPPMNGLAAFNWEKLGPYDLVVTNEAVTVKATSIKGSPQLMGILIERPEYAFIAPLLSPTDPLTLIHDAAGYQQIYQADLAKLTTKVPYEVDNTQLFNGSFQRIAYLLELQVADKPLQWVWTSMDAFTTNIKHIGVPDLESGAFFHQKISSLIIASNVEGLPTGIVGEGVLEFWPNNYAGTNQLGITGATNTYDFADQPNGNRENGHGSMQVGNISASQTVWALNNWKSGPNADLGIGPSTGKIPENNKVQEDWTFAGNAKNYTLKRLRVLVKPKP